MQMRTTPKGAPIELGMNVHGQTSHAKRDVWIVRVSDEFDVVRNPQVAADSIDIMLRKRLQKLRIEGSDTAKPMLDVIGQLGSRLQGRGQLKEAAPFLEEALKARRQQLGDLHPDTLTSINNLGMLFQAMGKLDEAAPLCRQQLGDLHPDTLTSINNLGMLFQAMGKLDEAAPLLEEAARRQR
eukprot:TRINITY_DN1378_c0_g1_i8.p2 TRINITY_DN1378_c0_g1~~TRINITY_DN1378_c0_g1_i8.p2  ORF type:complete len:210 (-),score=36.24 TRINITY_DN1378_c0_g1_i8:191-739(-)